MDDTGSLSNDKFLDLSKFKAFADDKSNVTENLKFSLGRIENNSGKGGNADYQHMLIASICLFFQYIFKSLLSQGLESGNSVVKS